MVTTLGSIGDKFGKFGKGKVTILGIIGDKFGKFGKGKVTILGSCPRHPAPARLTDP